MHFTLGANCYMFRHQDAILREFINETFISYDGSVSD
jgi:hypothetical protein